MFNDCIMILLLLKNIFLHKSQSLIIGALFHNIKHFIANEL